MSLLLALSLTCSLLAAARQIRLLERSSCLERLEAEAFVLPWRGPLRRELCIFCPAADFACHSTSVFRTC
jgi:hypothetical protein